MLVNGKIKNYNCNVSTPMFESSLGLSSTVRKNIEDFLLGQKDSMKHTTNVKAKMTYWSVHKDHKDIFKLSETVRKIVKEISEPNTLKYYTAECWGAIYNQGEETVLHNHFPYLWSWCYYIKTPEGSSPLVFPQANILFEPTEDELIIFPSYTEHLVPPCSCTESRIMIAGNIGLKTSYPTKQE